MVRNLGRAVLLALVVIVLGSLLATIPGTLASSTNYTLSGLVEIPIPPGGNTPAGVQVELISQATGAVYTTTTSYGGYFAFTSTTTSGLGPGYWGLLVPPQGNATFANSKGVKFTGAALPTNQTPEFNFWTASELTSGYQQAPLYATVLSYTTQVNGTVTYGTTPARNVPVDLLDPLYNGLILSNTTSNSSTGKYALNAPPGTWVLQAENPSGPGINTTRVTLPTSSTVNPNIQNYIVVGRMLRSKGNGVLTAGNATLYDPTTGYIYSTPTFPGGYYELGTYGSNFGSTAGKFDLFLSAAGYATVEHTFTTSGPTTPVYYNATLPPLASNQRGIYNTTLDFTRFDNATGTGNLTVNSTAYLGNDTVLTNLPNGTVSQMWSQLGLDFNSSTIVSAPQLSKYYAWVNASGPIFPAVQANTTINGTGFIGPTASQNYNRLTTSCATACGPGTTGGLTLNWSNTYALNGYVRTDSSTYSIGFGYQHPVSSSDIYNYTLILPAGYVLKAGTTTPTDTRLIPLGPDNTWSSFTLESLYDSTPSATAGFTIISATTIVAIVNATIPSYFAFSNQNVLNDTNGNYTVEVGVGQNVTFTAANTIYPTGINGTKWMWSFGDGATVNVTSGTTGATYHRYAAPTTGNTPDQGTLKIIGSNHYTNTTTFRVWVAQGPVAAGILSNATSSQNRTVGSTHYLFINWGTTLYFNATGSTAAVSSSTTAVKGVFAVASYTLTSKGFSQSANYSESAGAYWGSNYSYQFLGAGAYLTNGTVNGNLIPFKGWQYNLTLKVWTGTNGTSTTTLVILVNDTEKPVAAFAILNSAGTAISGKSIVAQSNLSAQIQLNAANSTDPHNGSVVRYYWLIGLTGNGTFHLATNVTSVKPYPKFWLTAAVQAYWVNLTVFDRNSNAGYTNQTLTVAANSTTTPILAASNMTGPSKVSEGSSYTYWVNITVGGGSKSTAQNIKVVWYLTSPGGTTRTYIGGSPGSVTFYNYTSKGIVNSVAMATGSIATLSYNTTIRAVLHWTPSSTGNFQIYANATATNEFVGDYSSATNVASMPITVSPNPTTQLLEYVAIAAAVVVAIALIVLYVRRRGGRGKTSKSTTGRSGLERGGKRSEDEDEEDESS